MDYYHETGALAQRAKDLLRMKPALVANVTLYATEDGGKSVPAIPGWGCPCTTDVQAPIQGYDAWPILTQPMQPGEHRTNVPFVFLTAEGAQTIGESPKFYLWEAGIIGEATVAISP